MVFEGLRDHFYGRPGLESALFPFHPQLFQVKGQRQEKKFGADVGLSPGQEAAESKVVFEQSKRALHLDGTAKTQMNSTFGHNVSGCQLPFFPEGFFEDDLLGLIRCLGPAALCPVWAPTAIFTPVPGGGHKLSVLYFCGLPSQVQLPALFRGHIPCSRCGPPACETCLSSFGHSWWAL